MFEYGVPEQAEPERYRVGDLFLDVETGIVSRQGEELALPPRTFELLLVLARHHPRRVRRQVLLETLWPDEIVSDQTLTHRVLLLRRALGDESACPRYIAADRGWGYHLAMAAEPLASETTTRQTPPPQPRRRLALPLALAALALGAGAVLFHVRSLLGGPSGGRPARPLVAVVPITCNSGKVAHEFVARRLTDRIESALGSDPDLRISIDAGAGDAGVDARVDGSLSARGEALEVRLRVTRPRSGGTPWNDGFEGSVYEVFAAEDHLASLVAAGVRQGLGLPGRSSEGIAVAREVSHLCLRGEWMTRSWQGPRLRQAASLFERAITLDKTSGRAHAGLGIVHAALALLGEEAPSEAAPLARTAAESAVRFAPDLADARVARGLVHLVLDWDLPGAERDLGAALGQAKSDPLPLIAQALFLQAAGSPDASLPLLELAQEADPDAAVVPLLRAHAHHLAGRCERALEAYGRALSLDPYSVLALSLAGACHSDLGQDALTLDAILRARGLAGAPAASLVSLQRAHARGGLVGLWRQVCEETNVRTLAPVAAASACARGGRATDAVRWLDRAVEQRAPGVLFVSQDPAFDPIRGTSGFREALVRSGLPDPASAQRGR